LRTGVTPYRIDQLKKIPVGNFGDSLNFTIQDSAGAAKNITGMTPKLTMYRPGPQREMNPQFQKDCLITSGSGGTCRYTVATGDFNTRTLYEARVDLHTGTTKVDSSEPFLLEVF
jgi:hypothetical protein